MSDEKFGSISKEMSRLFESNELNNMDNQKIFNRIGKKSTMSMLEYCKLLLSKVEFDEKLLQKEYQKGIKYLNQDEQIELMRWIHKREKK